MSVLRLHWQFKQRFNKLDSDNFRDLTPMEIDERLNDAVGIFGEQFFADESHVQRLDWLSPLIYTETIKVTQLDSDKYTVSLSDLTYKYWHIKRVNAATDCGAINFEIVGHGRLSDILRDEFQKPSKKWYRLVATLENNKIIIYTGGNWLIDSITITYVRYPKPVFFGGYNTIEYIDCSRVIDADCTMYNSIQSPIQDLEIQDETVRRMIVEYAVKEAHRILMNTNGLNLQNEKLSNLITN